MPLPLAIIIFWHAVWSSWGWLVPPVTRGREARKEA